MPREYNGFTVAETSGQQFERLTPEEIANTPFDVSTLDIMGSSLDGFDFSNIDLDEGEYIELRASVTDTNIEFHADAAAAPHPGIPSSVLSVNFVAPLPVPRPTPP